MDPKKRACDFLRHHRMHHEEIDADACIRGFLSEMERGLEGRGSSLEMIPTYIDIEGEIPVETPVAVIDAGGTNLRVAKVTFDREGMPRIENFSRHPMPGLEREVSKGEFFSVIAGHAREAANASGRIGFCFSYPTEMLPNRDGRLIQIVKEIKAREVAGELLGENLVRALGETGGQTGGQTGGGRQGAPPYRVVLLNDTVATLLAGRAAFRDKVFDGYIGFILGTGTNCCYIERNSNILKRPELDRAKGQVINVESGGFAQGPRGAIDLEFDRATADPGMHPFEKMISGAYLGPLCLEAARSAADEGLFSDPVRRELVRLPSVQTREANEFLSYPLGRGAGERGTGDGGSAPARGASNPLADAARPGTTEDVETLFNLVDALVERAAKLAAINLTAVVVKSGGGKRAHVPVCITAEGSTFHGMRSMRERVFCHLRRHLAEVRGPSFEIVSVENAALIGAAIAGLTN